MFALILMVYLSFCKLNGMFVSLVLLVLLYFCRLYKIYAFLYVRQIPDVYFWFCKLYGMFVCPVLLAHMYFFRSYETTAFLYVRPNPDCTLLFCKLQVQNIIYLKPIQPICLSQPFHWPSEAFPGHAIPLLFKRCLNTLLQLFDFHFGLAEESRRGSEGYIHK